MSGEEAEAVALANRVLDKPFIDPDGDIVMLARQFLRRGERCESWQRIDAALRIDRDDWRTRAETAERLLRKIGEIASPMCSPAAVSEIDVWRDRMAKLREMTRHLDRCYREPTERHPDANAGG